MARIRLLLGAAVLSLSIATVGATSSPERSAAPPTAPKAEAAWQQNGCSHGHGSRPARRGLRVAMSGPRMRLGRARHFVRCVHSDSLEAAQRARYRRWLRWRRSYRGWWRIQALRTPYHAALAGLRWCESRGDYHATNGSHWGAYQYLDSTFARAQWWVPGRYRVWRASLASVDHQDVVTGRFRAAGHAGEWACSG